jgi:hypothetical protein
MELMHKLVKLSDAERRRIIHQFIDEAFGDLDANPDMVAMLRSAMPELSDDPTPEQVDAWVELAELVQDPDFKASVRRAAEHQAADPGLHQRAGAHRARFQGDQQGGAIQPPVPQRVGGRPQRLQLGVRGRVACLLAPVAAPAELDPVGGHHHRSHRHVAVPERGPRLAQRDLHPALVGPLHASTMPPAGAGAPYAAGGQPPTPPD